MTPDPLSEKYYGISPYAFCNNNPDNFVIVNAETIYSLAPQMLEIFDAPYGTDLFWVYEENIHIGFYDLVADKITSIEQILA